MIAGLFVFRQWHQRDSSDIRMATLSRNRQQYRLDRRFTEIRLMSLHPLYRPLRPELDKFLYAAVGQEQEPVTLTVLSALSRLDLDPWDEASRLSALEKPEAGAQLAKTILCLTGTRWAFTEARRVADALVELLPSRAQTGKAAQGARAKGSTVAPGERFWLACLVVAAALLSVAAIGELPFANLTPLQSGSSENLPPSVR